MVGRFCTVFLGLEGEGHCLSGLVAVGMAVAYVVCYLTGVSVLM